MAIIFNQAVNPDFLVGVIYEVNPVLSIGAKQKWVDLLYGNSMMKNPGVC